ncbi:MAG TPA: hypothetical protein VNN73_12680 [Blastocatellia bacterium]|nr:hypothetical protein [Blastocatellia bacterium]
MVGKLNEDIIGKLAAQFDTYPEVLRMATDGYVATDESPEFYVGYITAVMTIGSLLSEQRVPINYDVLVILASKAAQLRQGLLTEEKDSAWIDKLNKWLDDNYRLEMAQSSRH